MSKQKVLPVHLNEMCTGIKYETNVKTTGFWPFHLVAIQTAE